MCIYLSIVLLLMSDKKQLNWIHKTTMFSLLRKVMQLVILYHQQYKMFNNIGSKFGIRVTENLRVPMQCQGAVECSAPALTKVLFVLF